MTRRTFSAIFSLLGFGGKATPAADAVIRAPSLPGFVNRELARGARVDVREPGSAPEEPAQPNFDLLPVERDGRWELDVRLLCDGAFPYALAWLKLEGRGGLRAMVRTLSNGRREQFVRETDTDIWWVEIPAAAFPCLQRLIVTGPKKFRATAVWRALAEFKRPVGEGGYRAIAAQARLGDGDLAAIGWAARKGLRPPQSSNMREVRRYLYGCMAWPGPDPEADDPELPHADV